MEPLADILPLREAPKNRQTTKAELLKRLPRQHKGGNEIWSTSTHIFPAAYPRSHAERTSTLIQSTSMNIKGAQGVIQAYLERGANAARCTSETTDQPQLYIVANRYRPKRRRSGKNGRTLIFGHPNGLNRECYEVLFEKLFSDSTVNIDEAWSLDLYNHGDSALLNAGKLQTTCAFHCHLLCIDKYTADWFDVCRDLCQFVLHHLPEADARDTPTILDRFSVDPELSSLKSKQAPIHDQWRGHRLCFVGHSVTSAASACASYLLPTVIHRCMLLDPVIYEKSRVASVNGAGFVLTSLLSRRKFESRQAAIDAWSKDRRLFFGWAPQAINNFAIHGLIETADGQVELKTDKMQEVVGFLVTFKRLSPLFEAIFCENGAKTPSAALECLRALPPHVKIHFLRGPNAVTAFCKGISNADIVKDLKGNGAKISVAEIPKAGHLITQMQPNLVSEEMLRILSLWERSDARL